MNKRYLVSILSQHLIPNFLLIKELAGAFDELIFITTQVVKEGSKEKQLEAALQLEQSSVMCITLTEDNYKENLRLLTTHITSNEDTYLVNLTGGTKIMSLSVQSFFQELSGNNTFFYLPIGKNSFYNLISNESTPIRYKLSVNEYFMLYGIDTEYSEPETNDFETPQQLFHRFRKVFFNRHKLDDIKFSQQQETPQMKRFYGGEWFEEYIYAYLLKKYSPQPNQIATGVKVFRANSNSSDNELDIVMIYHNELYVFECKVGLQGNQYEGGPIPTIEKSLYKLAAISKDFGLQVNSYLLTLHSIFNSQKGLNADSRENIHKRQQILGIRKIVDGDDFYRNKFEL